MIADLETCAAGTGAVDDSNPFMAQDPAWGASRDIPFQDMEVSAADCGLCNLHDSVIRGLNDGLRPFFQSFEAGTAINQGFHGTILSEILVSMAGLPRHALTPIKLSGGSH